MENRIVAVRYYNVWFYLQLQSELDIAKFLYLSKRIDAGENFVMKDLYRWCTVQKIKYKTKFIYRKDLQTAIFCGQQGRISRTVRAILSGQPGIAAGQRVLRPTDQYYSLFQKKAMLSQSVQ